MTKNRKYDYKQDFFVPLTIEQKKWLLRQSLPPTNESEKAFVKNIDELTDAEKISLFEGKETCWEVLERLAEIARQKGYTGTEEDMRQSFFYKNMELLRQEAQKLSGKEYHI